MTFKPKTWYPIALVLGVVNVASVWFAARAGEAPHATLHAILGVAFMWWAQKLRSDLQTAADDARLAPDPAPLDLEVDQLRRQLGEAEERLDFAERMLVQLREPDRAARRPGEPT